MSRSRHPEVHRSDRVGWLRAAVLGGNDGIVSVAGLVVGRQKPGTASGVIFLTLEDEFGMVNVVVWKDLGERQRRVLVDSQLLRIDGRLEMQHDVVHLIAGRLTDYTPLLAGLDVRSRDFR